MKVLVTRLASACMSDALRELAAGRPFQFPVAGIGAAWWMSRECVVRNLLRAGRLDAHDLQSQRVWLLPVLHASMLQIVEAVAEVYGEAVRRNASFAPNAQIQAQFAGFPQSRCPSRSRRGFNTMGRCANWYSERSRRRSSVTYDQCF
jgi:D-erythronate 2-dehydrogenase